MVTGLLKDRLFGKRLKRHGHRGVSIFLKGLRTLLHIASVTRLQKEEVQILRYLDIGLLRLLNLITNSAYYNLMQLGVV